MIRFAPRWGFIGNQRGVTLLTVLVMVVVIGLTLGMAGTNWRALMQREREEELFWRGDQYRRAIESYQQVNHGGLQRYPERLEDLLRDPRSLQVKRHLRRLYSDPMTGGDWVLVKDPAGGVKGVRSSSNDEPFKKDNFPEEYDTFVDRGKYSEWEFSYTPEKTRAGSTAGAGVPTAAGNLPAN
ncbi:hypothetical protein [Trichloromonas acetexigens]|uniref:Type II secretion system protein n=1 Tax=Trichloromonas acetexigens TaxID=38815 RepID=A0A550JGT0_9BACT|nr:hypothetical protein [Desulfuromonas acetexigens]TRO82429.1 type II secretion system protein [Desulfuromonas acetexigens]